MNTLVVVNTPKRWGFNIPGCEVVAARDYLTEKRFAEAQRVKVFNLCRSYRYQTTGYYVSLLAQARGHRPMPSVETLQDLRDGAIVRLASGELDSLVQKQLRSLRGDRFELSVYFGRNMAAKYDRLAQALFNQFQSPLLRAVFERSEGTWRLESVGLIGAAEIPDDHRGFVEEQAERFFARPSNRAKRKKPARWDLAILHNPDDPMPPSNPGALKRFIAAAERVGARAELIERSDQAKIGEFDALFIRDTTKVNHYTYRLARRAAAQGLVVIDDPESIIRCSNKVYLAEVMERRKIAQPVTVVFTRETASIVAERIGFPCVLKQPDSSFSAGVVKIESAEVLESRLDELFETSELLVAQEFVPTDFDWRVGVLSGEPLYACKYHMAKDHWQIVNRSERGVRYGRFETVDICEAPQPVVKLAAKAATLIGDGLYGVDLKIVRGHPVVIEVNDNPNIDHGVEDEVLGETLYNRIIRYFDRAIEDRTQ